MRPHFAARLHAFVHGLFRTPEAAETRTVYDQLITLFDAHGLRQPKARDHIALKLAQETATNFEIDDRHPHFPHIVRFIERMLDYEAMFILPDIDWSEKRNVAEWWDIRNELTRQKGLVEDFEETLDITQQVMTSLLKPIVEAAPSYLGKSGRIDDIIVPTTLIHSIGSFAESADSILDIAYSDDLAERNLFTRLAWQVEYNLIAASGGNPADPHGFTKTPVLPTKSSDKDPTAIADAYLAGTPIHDFLQQKITFAIPTTSRFEHHHMVAGSGHGKTQTLQYLIARDIEAIEDINRTVVVIDSQGDLIRNISQLAEFAPGGRLHERIVIIDPTDVEYPVSLNLFDVGIERLEGYAPLEKERLTNSILELYDFVLGSLLAAEMTQKQSVIFRYVTRLMLYIPNATIHTLRELMEPNSEIKFAEHIDKLEGSAKHFFKTEFSSKEFEQTKKQVLRRLWGILENQTFERMFSHPKSKLDLFAEMNRGKVILINTAKDLLKEQGSEIFGRFFIALIAQAAQERATLPESKRTPTFVYIDEAADYFDRNIGIILAQARKYSVGMVLAHQYLGQLDPQLQDAFAANTSIKFAGGVSAKDARALSAMLYCEPSLIEAQPKGSFAAAIRGVTKSALPLQFPFGHLENKPRMSIDERSKLQDAMREHYAVHYSELAMETAGAAGPTDQAAKTPPSQNKTRPNHQPKSVDDINTDAGESW